MIPSMETSREKGARFKRQRAELAISLAMQNRWENAATTNESILALFPDDVEALNRLGRALMELGRYDDAQGAYSRTLSIEPTNAIAQKNVVRLNELKAAPVKPVSSAAPVDPTLFIEEAGKTSVVTLLNLGEKDLRAKMSAGDQVILSVDGPRLVVTTPSKEYLGQVEPRLASRLITLIKGGNRYEAAITSMNEQHLNVIIREVYQAPNLIGRPSFPSRSESGFRPYMKESMLQYGLDDDDEDYTEDEEDGAQWNDDAAEETGFATESLSMAEDDEDDEDKEEV